jgi:hypothetical protein
MQRYPQTGGRVVNVNQQKPPVSTSFSHSPRETRVVSGQTINMPPTVVAHTSPQMIS